MNPFEMVVLIILIVTIGSVLRARFKSHSGRISLAEDPEAMRLREEMKTLKDRIAVLERIATDKNHLLEREFEKLRDER